jgi:hypothetical protein
MPGPRFVAPAVRSLSIIWQANSPSTTSSSSREGTAETTTGIARVQYRGGNSGDRTAALA